MTFTTPYESAAEQYALAACLAGLASIMVGLRFYAMREQKKRSFGHDDAWIIVALFFTWATAIDNILGAALGLEGQHTELSAQGAPVLTPRYVVFLKTIYVNQITQVLAVGPTKLSVLFFYRRIFRGYWFNVISWTMIGFASAWMVTFVFANLLECIPINQAWVSQVGGSGNPHCIDAIPMYLAQQYFDVIMDAIILVIPIPLVWKLQMPIERKLGVLSIFGVGILTIGASCAKLVIMEFVGTELHQHADISYYLTPMMYWPMIEAALGITAACMPKIASFFVAGGRVNMFFSRVLSKTQLLSLLSLPGRARGADSKTVTKRTETVWTGRGSKISGMSNWTQDEHWGSVNEAYTGRSDSDSIDEHRETDIAAEHNTILVKRVYGTSANSAV